jgi:hypothetical protein
MRFISLKILAPLASAALLAAPVLADDSDLGFEQGTIDGWTQDGGTAGATPAAWAPAQGDSPTFTAVEGDFFGYVTAGKDLNFATLSRTFDLQAGERILGYAGFANLDGDGYFPELDQFFDDTAFVSVNGVHLRDWNGRVVGARSNSGWRQFTFTARTAGFYTLQIGVANGGDDNVPSSVLLDDVEIAGPVPEAATWAMMVAGFGLAGVSLRGRRFRVSFG